MASSEFKQVVSSEFKQNVTQRNLMILRSMLLDYLIIDRSFDRFNAALKYACKSLPELIQPYDNYPFETSEDKWDIDYLNLQKATLMSNFSEERIDHIKKVIEKVLPEEKGNQGTPDGKKTGHCVSSGRTGRTRISEKVISPGTKHSEKKSKSAVEKLGIAMVVGGTAAAVVGLAAVEPIIIGAGVVVAGAGVGIQIKSKSD